MSWITTHSSFQDLAPPVVPVHTWTQATRLGTVLVAMSPRGVALLGFLDQDVKAPLARLAEGFAAAQLRVHFVEQQNSTIAREIDEYLEGKLRRFSVGVDLTSVRAPFQRLVLQTLCAVDYGHTTTYGQLARAVKRPKGARAVGQAVGMNPIAILVPCHRVLASDGSLGGYSAGLERKRLLLDIEGHAALPGGWPSMRR